jgi:hypothetical protein
MIHKAGLATLVSLAVLLAIAPTQAFAEPEQTKPGLVGKVVRGVKEKARDVKEDVEERARDVKEKSRDIEVDLDAKNVYERTPRQGTCEERRNRILATLPDALRFARLARDVYKTTHEKRMKTASLGTLDLGSGATAHYEASGSRYAEVHVDEVRREAVVVFRGTRPTVRSDVTADVTNFVGLPTPYYGWAAKLTARVVREHRGMQVITTGHSLGGGLAIFAVLRNPGVKGFAFNPAGLARLTWAKARRADRARTNGAVRVVSTRNERQIEPLTAVSFSKGSVLPGHIFVLEADVRGSVALHNAPTVLAALEQAKATNAGGSTCDGDLGVLAD